MLFLYIHFYITFIQVISLSNGICHKAGITNYIYMKSLFKDQN